jgi:maleate isomerase
MYGWRARIGIVGGGGAAEGDFPRMIPDGVMLYFQKFPIRTPKGRITCVEDLKQPVHVFADAAAELMRFRPASMTLCGTGLSFCGGFGYDKMIIEKMKEKNGGIPTTTSSTSVLDALNKMGIKKVSLATPYLEDVAKTAVKFFEDNGLQIIEYNWLGLPTAQKGMDDVSKEEVYHLVRDVDDPQSEAVIISCVMLNAIDVIEPLEADLMKPVVTSNQATIWNLLRMAGVNEKIQGFGQLFYKY